MPRVNLIAFGREMRANFEKQNLSREDVLRMRTPDESRTESKMVLLESIRANAVARGMRPW